MKTSKWIGIASLSVVLIVVTSTVVLSNYHSKTENAFSSHGEHAQLPVNIPHDELIIEYENIKITTDEFHQYKNNVELMANYQETDHSLTNKQLIENMMKEKLVLAYAKEKGIEASDEEAIQYAEEQRIILDEAASEEVQKFRDQLIKSKGMSPEEYWSDAQTIQDYKNWMTQDKLALHLQETGEIENTLLFGDFKNELWRKHENNITINHDLLNMFQ